MFNKAVALETTKTNEQIRKSRRSKAHNVYEHSNWVLTRLCKSYSINNSFSTVNAKENYEKENINN